MSSAGSGSASSCAGVSASSRRGTATGSPCRPRATEFHPGPCCLQRPDVRPRRPHHRLEWLSKVELLDVLSKTGRQVARKVRLLHGFLRVERLSFISQQMTASAGAGVGCAPGERPSDSASWRARRWSRTTGSVKRLAGSVGQSSGNRAAMGWKVLRDFSHVVSHMSICSSRLSGIGPIVYHP